MDREGRTIRDIEDYRDHNSGKLVNFTVEIRNGQRFMKGSSSSGDRRVIRRNGPREERNESRLIVM